MANYEIMLVVSGSLDEKEAKKVANEVATPIKDCKPKIHEYGSKQLAYKIKKDLTGYYFQYNFECESPANINEFRRLSTINKSVLRTLIINLEKDYGYKATINPKKIERNKKTAEIHAKIKAEIEKAKAAREAERVSNGEETSIETSTKKTKSTKKESTSDTKELKSEKVEKKTSTKRTTSKKEAETKTKKTSTKTKSTKE